MCDDDFDMEEFYESGAGEYHRDHYPDVGEPCPHCDVELSEMSIEQAYCMSCGEEL